MNDDVLDMVRHDVCVTQTHSIRLNGLMFRTFFVGVFICPQKSAVLPGVVA
jgi:hypothetical protein